MNIKKCLYFLLSFSLYNLSSTQATATYQPKTYTGLTSVSGKILYPGDIIMHTYTNSFSIDANKQPVDKNTALAYVPVVDTRYFVGQQISVVPTNSTLRNSKVVNYNITMKYTVKNINQSTNVNIREYSYWGAAEAQYDAGSLIESGGYLDTNITCTLLPLPDGVVAPALPSLPVFTGQVHDIKQLKDVTLYPGDVIEIKDFASVIFNPVDKQLLTFEYYLTSYAHFFDVYQDVVTDLVIWQNYATASNTTYNLTKCCTPLYLVVKDVVSSDIAFTISKWGGVPCNSYYNPWYCPAFFTCSDCYRVVLAPFPGFFNFAKDYPELKKILRSYISSKQGCTANSQDADKRTPLMWSVFYGNKELVNYFLSDPQVALNIQDKDGRTVLMYAAEKNNAEILNMITSNLASPFILKIQDSNGMTALHYALWNNNYQSATNLLNLSTAESVIDIQNTEGVTPLMYAAAQGNKRLVQLVLDKKPNYKLTDKNGFNCLFYACMSLNVEVVKLISNYITNINQTDAQNLLQSTAIDGTTILYNVLLKGKNDTDLLAMVEFLVTNGSKLSYSYDSLKAQKLQSYLKSDLSRGKYTTLIGLVASKGVQAQKTLSLLLQYGASVDKAAVQIAQSNGVFDTIKQFGQSAGPLLYQALYNGDTKSALTLVSQFSPNVSIAHDIVNYTNSGWSVLFLLAAQAKGNTMTAYNTIAQQMILRGANPLVTGPDAQGNPVTPLVLAGSNQNSELESILQKAPSNNSFSSFDSTGTTTLSTPSMQTSKTGKLIPGVANITGAAVYETVEPYDTLEYLLG